MSSAWLLPEHLADVLPAQAGVIEGLRRRLLDQAQRRGFELVIPPMLEHLESLLSGTGSELDLQTFKLVDQLSGRMLGLRADTTAQAARIDAHLLNRSGVTRLCYCGPVLRTAPAGVDDSREPLQFGAEVFGHAGLEADLEVLELALDVLTTAIGSADEPQSAGVALDLADARVLQAVLGDRVPEPGVLRAVVQALARKDPSEMAVVSRGLGPQAQRGLQALLDLHGGEEVLERASQVLPHTPLLLEALADLRRLSGQIGGWYPGVAVGFDLSDMGGYAYYSGVRFGLYAGGWSQAVIRGGRYDEVGSVFGRKRPAVGFSLDVKALASQKTEGRPRSAIRAPWSGDVQLRGAIRRLREMGETVVLDLPGSPAEECGRDFDRELTLVGGRWVLQAL